jgi:ATP synthase protein I
MSDKTSRGDRRPEPAPPIDDAGLTGRLRDLDRRLDESRAEHVARVPKEPQERPQGVAMALRLGADFVAGVVVGAAIGWGIDRLFGVSPWGLIVFVLLGFAAGVLSVLRSAGLIAKRPGIDDPISRRFE